MATGASTEEASSSPETSNSDEEPSISHPLLDEMKGLISRLKKISQPIQDDSTHLVPYCETLEAIFRYGLKQPNSFFGLNKQDYWSWIEPLGDYYFNEKQNPLLHDLIHEIGTSTRMRTLQGRGRCYIRAALTNKLISVPIEHLAKSAKLTEYWYHSWSIIGNMELRAVFMELLFQTTEIDFDLDYRKSGFLNETWIIPVYMTYRLPPVKTLDIGVRAIHDRQLVVSVEKDCLACKAGIEIWDIVEELCGEPIYMIPSGKYQKHLLKYSVNHTEVTVVKKYLSNGSPFAPVLRRQLLFTHQMITPTSAVWIPEFLNSHSPSVIRTIGENTEYSVVFLGKHVLLAQEVCQKLIDSVVSQVLNETQKAEDIALSVGSDAVTITFPSSKIWKPVVTMYRSIVMCEQSTQHQSCFVLVAGGTDQVKEKGGEYNCYICETSTIELAQCVCMHVAQGQGSISLSLKT